MAIPIENKSGKVITHVGIAVRFDRPVEQNDQTGALWEVWYGANPFALKSGEAVPPLQVRPIQPDETESVVLSAAQYDALKSFLKEIKIPLSIDHIHLSVSTIGFADGTAWRGTLYRPNKSAPDGWSPVNPPQTSVRKPIRLTLCSFLIVTATV